MAVTINNYEVIYGRALSMLSISFLQKHTNEYKDMLQKRGVAVDVDAILSLDIKRRELISKAQELRTRRNELAKEKNIEGEKREEAKQLKVALSKQEEELASIEQDLEKKLLSIPNILSVKTPVGKSEKDNVEHRIVGKVPKFDFEPKDHLTLATNLGMLDFETGAKVSGSQFYYLKGDLVLLEQSLIRFALDELVKEGFVPVITPDMAKSRFYLGTGYQPKGDEAQIYTIEGEDLGLVATAEITLAGLHADQILDFKRLPIKYVGVSHCFRKEAGAYGKYSKGLYRVHQFTKVEMFTYTTPEESESMHEYLLSMEESIYKKLEIPYRVLEMCSVDLGSQAIRKFDVEAWMPGRPPAGGWGEVTSTSNTTDFQTRRLNIKYRTKDNTTDFAHTLNGTAIATSRTLIAILENYQQKDGTIGIPKILQPYMGKDSIS